MYFASFVVSWPRWNYTLAVILIVASAWRIMEIITFHLNMLIARPGRPGGVATVASRQRTLVLALANYLEITLWFATWYSIAERQEAFVGPKPLPLSIFRESLAMMLVNAPELFKPKPGYGFCGQLFVFNLCWKSGHAGGVKGGLVPEHHGGVVGHAGEPVDGVEPEQEDLRQHRDVD
jgi:hypothetical protein